MNKLPVLISIPHGGTMVPDEVKNRFSLTKVDLFDDSDAFTDDIYNLKTHVSAVVSACIARAFVDVNRSPDDLPDHNPDGVVKSHTCYGKIIYQSGLEPDDKLTQHMLEKYYYPYHHKIQKILNDDHISITLALDCHSMAAIAPTISPDEGEKRPMICLGNVHGKSCPSEMIEKMAHCFREAFSLKAQEVSINRPFAGGYITQAYGNQKTPWIQVELNRKLYLEVPYFDTKTLSVDKKRLEELRKMFEEALQLLFRQ
jgi:formiminoglutamase